MGTRKNFIFLKELEQAELPVYQIVKETYLFNIEHGEEFRELTCVGQSLLNLIVDRELTKGDSRAEVFNEIKKSLPTEGIRIADVVAFAKSTKYFKDLEAKGLYNPTFLQAWAVLNELDKTLVVFDTVDGAHSSYITVKNKEIFSDGIKIRFEDLLKIIYSGKTYFCCLLNEEEQQIFL